MTKSEIRLREDVGQGVIETVYDQSVTSLNRFGVNPRWDHTGLSPSDTKVISDPRVPCRDKE